MYTQLRCQTVWVNLIEPAPALPDGFMLLSKTNQSTCPAAHLMEMLIFHQSKSAGDTLPKNCVVFFPPLCKEIDSEAQNWLRGAGRGGQGWGETTKPGDVWAKQGSQQLRERHLKEHESHLRTF